MFLPLSLPLPLADPDSTPALLTLPLLPPPDLLLLLLQTLRGREFSGDAFISTPTEVVFKDFTVGQTYTHKVCGG